jgi:hypothetical protein
VEPALNPAGVVSCAVKLGFAAFAAGALSLALLGASIAWAHHWSFRADALVTGWGVSTVAALVLSVLGLRGPRGAKGFAAYGLLFGILSVLALALAGAAYAAGMDPGAACGGG